MLHFSCWKVLAILAVVLAGAVFAVPNILPKPWQDTVRHYTGLAPMVRGLALVLRSGALPAPISYISIKQEP